MRLVKQILLASVLGVHAMATPASAEFLMFSYSTVLGRTDAFSSSGVPLQGLCEILRQDRANYHRFMKRDPDDGPDPFFVSQERRDMMMGKCETDANVIANPGKQIRRSNREFRLNVLVFGDGVDVARIQTSDDF